ncbi:gfo/Idh/MocA family oxidoreductase [Neobacillus notoginsengisoli]|uniref:Gfo/Idh/MocA family oxidoreductase n=1 Tax=Neobacillus notoginsengisoli TaxID=1578198 RepID=A0A417YY19_9BACI|nr:Gfo/Idh/MocA family oxidoreductase [Neobacillus notoginsengisoli]RHW42636.1 gfo/Idh/MocA family oxidoreductase [Neobacillus notoginsengisoli]
MRKLKVAIIGPGQIAEKVHAAYYATRNDVELVAAVHHNNIDKAREFAKRNGIPRYYTNADEMYEIEKPDIVSVCTPNKLHYGNVMQALKAGCHVLCEKPPALTSEEAKEMLEYSRSKNLILAYNFHNRFADDVGMIKEQVQQGALGEIYAVKVKALRRSGVPGWGSFTNKDLQGGGPLIDLGSHMLDAAFYVMGFPKVKKVTAKMFRKIGNKKSEGTLGKWDPSKYEVEDSFFGFIELEEGGLIQVESSFALNIKETSIMNVEFLGDEAGASLFPAQIYTDRKGELTYLLNRGTADPNRHQKSIKAFVDRCLGKPVMIADAEQGYKIQELIGALYESAEKGDSVLL